MAGSRIPRVISDGAPELPARTPGALGRHDGADPREQAAVGDTPGALGNNDCAAAERHPGLTRCGPIDIPVGEADRAVMAARWALPKLPEEIRDLVAAALSRDSLAMMGAATTAWAASHAIGIGELVDVFLAGVGIGVLGREAVDAGRHFVIFWRRAAAAKTEEDVDVAAGHFAKAVAAVGVNSLLVLFGRRSRTASHVPVAAEVASVDMATWFTFIQHLDLACPRDKGMLWSKLGALRAQLVAEEQNLVTVEMRLKRTGFWQMYDRQFTSNNPASARIWELISRRFARGLEGKVTAVVDLKALDAALQRAARRTDGRLPVETDLPLVTAELEEIAELMEAVGANPRITSVLFVDRLTGATRHMLPEDVRRATAMRH
jgi:hypothetical protein